MDLLRRRFSSSSISSPPLPDIPSPSTTFPPASASSPSHTYKVSFSTRADSIIGTSSPVPTPTPAPPSPLNRSFTSPSRTMLRTSDSSSTASASGPRRFSLGQGRPSSGAVPALQDRSASSPAAVPGPPKRGREALDELHPLLTLVHAHQNKAYFSGYLAKRDVLSSEGKPLRDGDPRAQFEEVFAQLLGTTLSVWVKKDMDEAAARGSEVPPKYINITDAHAEALGLVNDRGRPMQNVFVLNSAGLNRQEFSAPSARDLISWVHAIRLAICEKKRLEEIYTAHLLRVQQFNVPSAVPPNPGSPPWAEPKTPLVKGKMEGWVRARFMGSSSWTKYWLVLTDHRPEDRKRSFFGSSSSSPTPFPSDSAPSSARATFPSPPNARALAAFYTTKAPKRSAKPARALEVVTQAFAVFPEKTELIRQSTLLKVEGMYVPGEEGAPGRDEGWCMIMPELEEGRPPLTAWNEMLRWVIGFHDAFELYGRPAGYNFDPKDARSMFFAYPFGPFRDRLFLDRTLAEQADIRETRGWAIHQGLLQILHHRMKLAEQQRRLSSSTSASPSQSFDSPRRSSDDLRSPPPTMRSASGSAPPVLPPITESGDPSPAESWGSRPPELRGAQALLEREEAGANAVPHVYVKVDEETSPPPDPATFSPGQQSFASQYSQPSFAGPLSPAQTSSPPTSPPSSTTPNQNFRQSTSTLIAPPPASSPPSQHQLPGLGFDGATVAGEASSQALAHRPNSALSNFANQSHSQVASRSQSPGAQMPDESSFVPTPSLYSQASEAHTIPPAGTTPTPASAPPLSGPPALPKLNTSFGAAPAAAPATDNFADAAAIMSYLHMSDIETPTTQGTRTTISPDNARSPSSLYSSHPSVSRNGTGGTMHTMGTFGQPHKTAPAGSDTDESEDEREKLDDEDSVPRAVTAPLRVRTPGKTPSPQPPTEDFARTSIASTSPPPVHNRPPSQIGQAPQRRPSGARAPPKSRIASTSSVTSTGTPLGVLPPTPPIEEDNKKTPAPAPAPAPVDDAQDDILAAMRYAEGGASERSDSPEYGRSLPKQPAPLPTAPPPTGSFPSSFAANKNATERQAKAQAEKAARQAALAQPGRAPGAGKKARGDAWARSSDEEEEEEEEEEDDDDDDESDGDVPVHGRPHPPTSRPSSRPGSGPNSRPPSAGPSAQFHNLPPPQQQKQYRQLPRPLPDPRGSRVLPQPPQQPTNGSGPYPSSPGQIAAAAGLPQPPTLSMYENGRASPNYDGRNRSSSRPRYEEEDYRQSQYRQSYAPTIHAPLPQRPQSPGRQARALQQQRASVWNSVLDTHSGTSVPRPNEDGPDNSKFVDVDANDTLTKAFTPHGLLQAGLADREARSAKNMEAIARETGSGLVAVPQKPPPPQAGLLGAISAHERERNRVGGLGAQLTERARDQRAAEAAGRRLEEMGRMGQMDPGMMQGGFDPYNNPYARMSMMGGMGPPFGMNPMMGMGMGGFPPFAPQPFFGDPSMGGMGMGMGGQAQQQAAMQAMMAAQQAYQMTMYQLSQAGSQAGGSQYGGASPVPPQMMMSPQPMSMYGAPQGFSPMAGTPGSQGQSPARLSPQTTGNQRPSSAGTGVGAPAGREAK